MTAKRRVDFVRNARGQQPDGAELVGLRQLRLQRNALRDVVDENNAADGDEVARKQRGDRDVGGALFAGARGDAELVEMMHARIAAEPF